MNNFEKALLLSYFTNSFSKISFTSSCFEDFFSEFIKEFKISKNKLKPYFNDGLNLDAYSKREMFKKDLKQIISKESKKKLSGNALLLRQFEYVKEIYKLDKDELDVVMLLVIKNINPIFNLFFDCVRDARRYSNPNFVIQSCLSINTSKREKIMEELYYKKLTDSKRNDVDINDFWLKIFNNKKYNSIDKIMNLIMGKPEKSKLKLEDYSHIEDKAKTAIDILSNSIKEKRKGVNILLYGIPGTGKTEFAKLMANSINVPIYSVITKINKFEEANRNQRLFDLVSKLHVLDNSSSACILFDEAEDVMNAGFSFFDNSASKGHMNNILETTPVPVIWTTNNIRNVDPAFLRRMTYTIEFEKLPENSRLNIWNRILKKNKYTIEKTKLEELNKTYNVSPSIIENAAKTAKMIGGSEEKFEELIENVASVVEKKKNIKNNDNFEARNYDISLVNADLDMNNLTNKIIDSGKLNFSLCLYGEPGTGKSEYAKYLADKLGLEVVYKKASDLLSMWVGGTEENIARAFSEAKDKKAMLIFDEADSFLQNRSNAQRSWEVTQVNEMLTWMESHQYPFICTTNLINSLDEACLRRFTFKVKFDFMKPEQVNRAIEHFFGIKNSSIAINGLTTGDFAVVKKKVDFLGTNDIDEITQMLNDEVKVKKSPNLKTTVGF